MNVSTGMRVIMDSSHVKRETGNVKLQTSNLWFFN